MNQAVLAAFVKPSGPADPDGKGPVVPTPVTKLLTEPSPAQEIA
ncbi:hypothetical protein HMPREF1979_01071 [Actinomyces johnsonii F0542]|uniref:Uncharacterized protein n=1 Tax=Actinomyces johnsonii F0542 TaxID=1321818 RepID=U1RYK0_9ACTO|nr:hypothetical protein HMPREF1979_01071 [Actinomyces johnsonii F0542]